MHRFLSWSTSAQVAHPMDPIMQKKPFSRSVINVETTHSRRVIIHSLNLLMQRKYIQEICKCRDRTFTKSVNAVTVHSLNQ